jgi:sugar phosphate isomerase/epimerase
MSVSCVSITLPSAHHVLAAAQYVPESATTAAPLLRKSGPMSQPALSVQLYAVNDQLTDDLDGTLARLSGMGLRNVEAFDFVTRAPELAEAFTRHGLAAKTGHATFLSDELRVRGTARPVPAQKDVFEAAQTLGLDILIDAFVSPDRWLDEEQVAATADRLNQAAERAADYGLRVGYHNHTQEFEASFGGRPAFEVFAEQLRDDVTLEVDLYWAATAKQDVPALLSRLGDRVRALHVKDGFPGPDPMAMTFDRTTLDQRPAGQGEVPLLDCLAAAPSTEFAVIEFDHYAGDMFDGIQASVSYLNEHGVR